MKKLLLAMLVLLILCATVSCTDNTLHTPTTEVPTQTAEPTSCQHNVVKDASEPATCTETGLTEGSHCSICNEVLIKQETIPAKGHAEQTLSAVAPTCTETGLTEGKKCSVCGEIIAPQDSVAATGHTIVTDAAVAATCTKTGKTEGKHCSVCNVVIEAQTTIPTTAHNYGSWSTTKASSCTSEGTEQRKCSSCNKTETRSTTALGHNYSSEWTIDVAATCTSNGSKSHHCTRCGAKKDVTIIEKTAHTIATISATQATCTSTGLTEGKYCSVCGTVITQQTITEKTNHVYSSGHCIFCAIKDPNYKTPDIILGEYIQSHGTLNSNGEYYIEDITYSSSGSKSTLYIFWNPTEQSLIFAEQDTSSTSSSTSLAGILYEHGAIQQRITFIYNSRVGSEITGIGYIYANTYSPTNNSIYSFSSDASGYIASDFKALAESSVELLVIHLANYLEDNTNLTTKDFGFSAWPW